MYYRLRRNSHFLRKYKKLTKRNYYLKVLVDKVFTLLSEFPFDSNLKTHKAEHKIFGRLWSSEVTKDLRISWDLQKNKELLKFSI